MMTDALDLIYLVSCTVNGQKPDLQRCAEMDISVIFELAQRHFLIIAAATALSQAVTLPAYFIEEQCKAVRRLLTFSVEWEKLQNEMERRGIWYMPLKGVVIKDYYHPPEIREMCDNDILFDAARADDVKALLEQAGYSCVRYNSGHHDIYNKCKYLTFEMHRYLFEEHEFPQLFSYYRNIRERMVADKGKAFGYHLTQEDFYIFLICHLYKHYRISGTGLRSLLDIYVFRRAAGAQMDAAYIGRELKKLGLLSFEQDTARLAQKVFSQQALNAEEQTELDFYIVANSHGSRNILTANRLKNDDSLKSKGRCALRRIFPSQEKLKRSHPFVSRQKILYPLLVVYRPIKGMVKHRKQMKKEIHSLIRFKQTSTGKYSNDG